MYAIAIVHVILHIHTAISLTISIELVPYEFWPRLPHKSIPLPRDNICTFGWVIFINLSVIHNKFMFMYQLLVWVSYLGAIIVQNDRKKAELLFYMFSQTIKTFL